MSAAPTKDGRLSRSEQTRAALLTAAADAFADKGYGGTALSTIYKAAGANAAAISYHFGGKRALYDAVLADSGARFKRLFDTMFDPELFDDVERLVERVWGRIRAESTHARIVLRAVLDDGAPPESVAWMRREQLPDICARVAPPLGVTPYALHMLVISMNLLASRFAVVDDAELCALTGQPTVDDANRAVVAQITILIRGWLHQARQP